MRHSVVALLMCLGSAVFTLQPNHWTAENQDDELYYKKKCCSWKCLKFALQWPGGFCVGLADWSYCSVPPNVNNWTIHGLWPLQAQHCCLCWPIFKSDVKELEPELSDQWPSLLTNIPSFRFWKQEWEKHGVCAACVEGMNSPLHYFRISLKLRAQFDIEKYKVWSSSIDNELGKMVKMTQSTQGNVYRALNDAGIKPSCNQTYELAEFHSALAPILGEHHDIQCVQDDKGREVWVQLKIPISRNLTLGCEHHPDPLQDGDPADQASPEQSPFLWHPCPPQTPLYHVPIDHQQPHQPCG